MIELNYTIFLLKSQVTKKESLSFETKAPFFHYVCPNPLRQLYDVLFIFFLMLEDHYNMPK